jgi:hypothetical protein
VPAAARSVLAAALVLLGVPATSAAQAWPSALAPHVIQVSKASGLEDPGGLPDAAWIHLHRGHHSAPDAVQAMLRVRFYLNNSSYDEVAITQSGLSQIRFLVHGVDVSGWLPLDRDDFTWNLHIDNPGLNGLADGIHDISTEVQGAARPNYKPAPIFVHVTRGRAVSDQVPIMAGSVSPSLIDAGPHVQYVRAADRQWRAYPLEPEVEPFHELPDESDTFGELMNANAEWATTAQMWWEELPHGLPFVRALAPKLANDDHRTLRVVDLQERLPFKDGGRGIGWMGGLVTGQVDNRGRFAFAEAGGRVGYLMPDGEIVTVAGWRVRSDKDPVWITKSMTQIRGNEELRGTWLEGAYPGEAGGFRTPMDIAIDPRNEYVWYVASYEDHCIWRVIVDPGTLIGTVSVFAGDPGHSRGSADGQGHAARFSGPTSIVFDPVADVMYVADQDQHLIRRISRGGAVTTLFGRPDMVSALASRGVTNRFDRTQVRPRMQLGVTPSQAASGVRPELYVPMTVRVDSRGRLIVLDLGDGFIRRIDPATGVTDVLGDVDSKFEEFAFGWAWLDVDRWGNTGPKDGIYWCKAVGANLDGEPAARFNEFYAWMPADGGPSRFVFGDNWEPNPNGWGDRESMGPEHYAWLVAVDPRGALLVTGMGEHGISRLRAKRSSDRAPAELYPAYYEGQEVWWRGSSDGSVPSFALKFGWDGHNYLGFPDAWGLAGNETDQQLFDYFSAPSVLRNDAPAASRWLYAVRANQGPRTAPLAPRLTLTTGGIGTGTVSTADGQIACGADCTHVYTAGAVVTIVATPAAGSSFAGWTGAADCLDGQVTLGRGLVCTAIFNPGTACGYTLTPVSAPHLSAGGGSGTASLNTQAGCPWTASATPGWLTLTSAASGSGPAVLAYTAPANGAASARTGSVTVNGATHVVTQDGTSCQYTASPSSIAAPSGGGSGPVAVTTTGACAWSAVSGATWITFSGATSGTGSGSVTWIAEPNASGALRSGTIVVAGVAIVVAQPTPVHRRYLAEGSTGAFFDTRLALLNPNAGAADATLRFQRDDGTTITHTLSVPGRTRRTVVPRDMAGLDAATFSTVVESTQPLVVDRTMRWPTAGYGSHAETSVDGPSATWYLAEGATGGPFDLFYLLQNPNPTDVTVTVTYLRPSPQPPIEKAYLVRAGSRANIYVDREEFPAGSGARLLEATDVSARLVATQPIVVERAMYLSRPDQAFAAGHSSAGVTAPATSWYLAEGATGGFFDLFILIANPGSTAAVVEARYLTATGRTLTKSYTVAANSRRTVYVDVEQFPGEGAALSDAAVSTTLTSTNGVPVIVERAMWWPEANWYEAHSSPGATATSARWALADGEVGGADATQTYILLANTGATAGSVRVTLCFEDGSSAVRTFAVAASSRFNVDVATEFPAAAGRRFGAIVESLGASPAPIVVERAMYTSVGGVLWSGGTNALGTPLP